MKKIPLIIEKSASLYFGRIKYENNLIVDEGKSVDQLEAKLRKLLGKFHDIDKQEFTFEHKYDLSALFDRFHYLKITSVADKAGINSSLLRQYVIGKKQASANQALKIEKTLHELGNELRSIKVFGK